jgi:hypothetical protein
MRRFKRQLTMVLILTTFVLFIPHIIQADDTVNPNTSITKHPPVVQTSPEIIGKKKISWWWYVLGAVIVAGGVAVAASSGGGGGGGDGTPVTTEQTGTATVTW